MEMMPPIIAMPPLSCPAMPMVVLFPFCVIVDRSVHPPLFPFWPHHHVLGSAGPIRLPPWAQVHANVIDSFDGNILAFVLAVAHSEQVYIPIPFAFLVIFCC